MDFTEFFGSDELTLSGYYLNKQLAEFQEFITKKRLADRGFAAEFASVPDGEKLVRNYLEDPAINAWIWQRLAKVDPAKLAQILQTVLERTDFQLDRDLDSLLQEFKKPLEPELPEIASVPQHLHNLFQQALGEVNKSKSQPQDKKKSSKGFKT